MPQCKESEEKGLCAQKVKANGAQWHRKPRNLHPEQAAWFASRWKRKGQFTPAVSWRWITRATGAPAAGQEHTNLSLR